MSKQPVITHTNAQAARDPPEENCDDQSFPCEEKQRHYGAGVKQTHEKAGHPVDFFVA
jgi:hypothetical protein